jgi:hypothetical protein
MSDGLTTRHLTAARLYENGADHRLTVDGFPHLALVRNAVAILRCPMPQLLPAPSRLGNSEARQGLSVDASGKALGHWRKSPNAKGAVLAL